MKADYDIYLGLYIHEYTYLLYTLYSVQPNGHTMEYQNQVNLCNKMYDLVAETLETDHLF